MHIRIIVTLFCLLALAGLARAGDTLEIIPLQHRTAEEVIPRLQPFLEPGGPGRPSIAHRTSSSVRPPDHQLCLTPHQV